MSDANLIKCLRILAADGGVYAAALLRDMLRAIPRSDTRAAAVELVRAARAAAVELVRAQEKG